MTLHKLSELSGWELEDKEQDIRERPLVSSVGGALGIIKDLAVDLDSQHVVAVVTSLGESYAVSGLDIELDRVVSREPPISGGTSHSDERSASGRINMGRIIQLK